MNSQSIAVTYEQNPMSAMENLQVSTLKHVRKLGNWVKTLKWAQSRSGFVSHAKNQQQKGVLTAFFNQRECSFIYGLS